jgi:hypothetical protein
MHPAPTAYAATQFGKPLVEEPICATCAGVRWSVSVVITPLGAGDPDAPCGNCNRALRHALCTVSEDGAAFTPAGEECAVCTEDATNRLRTKAARDDDDALNRRLAEARGK